ncbi:hypothetical protein NQ318_019596 [Aromia moschata]|uniref:EFHB C-terminal EF-hand domain-containing protein n=1 Tax=Aromia moschata TaxID=1265417 RepID=A0AAV8Z4E4_9CUCU|nr:hypothetical protein NQ318_019596 [Aromia moschata]
MANAGKFIDRYPLICAAGKSTGVPVPEETVSTTLKEYPIDDAIDTLKHEAQIWTEDVFVPPRMLPPIKKSGICGNKLPDTAYIESASSDEVSGADRELKRDPVRGFWKKPLGTGRDQVPGLPAGAIPIDITFGRPTVRETTVKELVNPPKTHYQVVWDSQVGHHYYRKTHNDYNPSEQVDRGYNSYFLLFTVGTTGPRSDPTGASGPAREWTRGGIWVRCCCDWHKKEPVVYASKIQAGHLDRVKPKLGKALAPDRILETVVPKGTTFGRKSSREFLGVEDLLKDPTCPPCIFKRDLLEWISSLNKFRVLMKKRSNKGFNYDDFYQRCLCWDKERSGLLPINVFYEQCVCDHLTYPKEHLESLMKVLNIIIDDKINYGAFIDMLNCDKPPLELMRFNDVPPKNQYYVTTSQAAVCDYLIVNNALMPTAGLPSRRCDLAKPIKPLDGCRADIDELGDVTTATTVLCPSIYTNYGLTHRDFFEPRSREAMRGLFEKVGYNFPGNTFEKLWKEGVERDKTGCVCINTFKTLVKTCCPPPKVLVDEVECDVKMK